jgi:long-chain acyl-CoA synthetase
MFFNQLAQWQHRPALIEGQQHYSYAELAEAVSALRRQLPGRRSLILLKAANSITTVVPYLACLQAGHVVLLVDENISAENQQKLIHAYDPACCIEKGQCREWHKRASESDHRVALLLSTSGSTGSPKQVALSADNLQANARAICDYLPIEPADRTITTLPFHYSYGLSVIHSHLLSGACIVLNQASVVSREFWQCLEQQQISSFAGVPYSYEMLLRLKLTDKTLPSLRYFTQAGGKLDKDRVVKLADWAHNRQKQFFVMYGQTEATARMAFNAVPGAKPGAIGRAIPGGAFLLRDKQGQTITRPQTEGELIYQGPNIMLGYVESATDLQALTPHTELATGDLAWFDEQGDFYISGRLTRFIKPFGQRINLDETEQLLNRQGISVLAVGDADKLQLLFRHHHNISAADLRDTVSTMLNLHPSMIAVKELAALPILENGKPDYQQVHRIFNHD